MNITFSGTPLEVRREMEIALGTVLGSKTQPVAPEETSKVEKTKPAPKVAPEMTAATPQPVTSGVDVTAKLLGEEIPKKVKSAGRDAVVALLAKYDAKKGSELKPEQYAAFYADLGLLA